MGRFTLFAAVLSAAMAVIAAAPANAQATRTWVSGLGDDINPCSRTSPCKTFAGAISKTAAGGEISVLDAGGYGAVTITKSISIVAEGPEGSILGAGTNAIIINAGPGDHVLLHGLFIEGAGTGLAGIKVIGAGDVLIRNCLIHGFSTENGAGIDIATATNTRVFISDTTFARNTTGIAVKNTATAAPGAAGPVPGTQVLLERTQVIENTGTAIAPDGVTATVRLKGSTVAYNAVGLGPKNGGKVFSLGDNLILANSQDGAVTAKLPLQ